MTAKKHKSTTLVAGIGCIARASVIILNVSMLITATCLQLIKMKQIVVRSRLFTHKEDMKTTKCIKTRFVFRCASLLVKSMNKNTISINFVMFSVPEIIKTVPNYNKLRITHFYYLNLS